MFNRVLAKGSQTGDWYLCWDAVALLLMIAFILGVLVATTDD